MPPVKERIIDELQKQAEINLGMSMTFTLFEWLKEAKDELLECQSDEASLPPVSEVISDMARITVEDTSVRPEREREIEQELCTHRILITDKKCKINIKKKMIDERENYWM